MNKQPIHTSTACNASIPLGIEGNSPVGGLFYVQDKRSFIGDCVVWWRKGGRGYTSKLELAEKWTREDAFAQAKIRDTDVPWPCDVIDQIARHTVDQQYMPGTGLVQEKGDSFGNECMGMKKNTQIHACNETNLKNTDVSICKMNQQHKQITNRFLICRCKTCTGLTFSSWYDSLEDIEGANKELKRLRKQNRDPQIEEFQDSDPRPAYCDCKRPKRSEKAPA